MGLLHGGTKNCHKIERREFGRVRFVLKWQMCVGDIASPSTVAAQVV